MPEPFLPMTDLDEIARDANEESRLRQLQLLVLNEIEVFKAEWADTKPAMELPLAGGAAAAAAPAADTAP
eukprot:m.39086 g.39086  ORF g.39086 m.39086 type:complete len:70 (+) comp10084_c0_seq1:962-1171(+)